MTTPATDEYAHVRAAFHTVAAALMGWADPPELTPREYRRLELVEEGYVYRPYDPQGEVEPFDVQADWEENNT